jgi:hypothetical protein
MSLGGITLDGPLLAKLQDYVNSGGHLLVNAAHLPLARIIHHELERDTLCC